MASRSSSSKHPSSQWKSASSITQAGNKKIGGTLGPVINSGANNKGTFGSTNSSSTRKLKIKPFSRPPSLPNNFYDRTSSILLEATLAILRHEPLYYYDPEEMSTATSIASSATHSSTLSTGSVTRSGSPTSTSSLLTSSAGGAGTNEKRPISREELYKSVEDLCIHKFGPKLYQQVASAINDAAMESLSRLSTTAGAHVVRDDSANSSTHSVVIGFPSLPPPNLAESVLQNIQKIYREYTDYLFFVRSIFLYLDRSYVLQQQQNLLLLIAQQSSQHHPHHHHQQQQQRAKPLWEVGIDSLKEHMTRGTSKSKSLIRVASVLIHSLLQLIERDRDGEIVDRTLLRDSVRMLSELHLYQECFITPLLDTSATYYSKEGIRVIGTTDSDIASFLKHVETRLDQCQEACVEYLEPLDSINNIITTPSYTTGTMPPSPAASNAKLESSTTTLSGRYHGYVEPTGLDPLCTVSPFDSPFFFAPSFFCINRTRKALLAVVENNMLKPHVDVILSPKNCFPLFQDKDRILPNVRRMYLLLSRIGYQEQLKDAFYKYARHSGLDIVQEKASAANVNDQCDVVAKLLRWKSDLDYALVEAFDSQESFQLTIRDVLEFVVNVRGHKMSEWLAKHVGSVLKASKGKQDMVAGDDVEATLEQIMVLFRRLHAKDIFEAFYQKDLSKRLLQGKSSSIDLERTFLSKLKAECGTAYTSKMEGMFKDMDLSRDIISQYSDFALRDAAALNSRPTVEMDVQVLTTGYWPQFPQQKSIKLPEELKVHVSRFENYYDNKYQGRRITWQYSLCNCLVKANFPGKKVELLVSLYQALVLRCFNDHDTLSIPQIMEQTGIEDRAEVERLLHSLTTGKQGTRVLIMKPSADGTDMKVDSRSSNKKSISDTDEFCYNSRFTSKLNRLKIPTVHAKDIGSDADNSAKIHEAASRDRAYLIDAAIVRIMKARKTMPHRDLMGEVMNQVKHVSRPTPTEIKKRIEGLMEREYLERDASDKSVYNYLA